MGGDNDAIPDGCLREMIQTGTDDTLRPIEVFSLSVPEWRNWQTQWTQNPPDFGPCRFDSYLGHQLYAGHRTHSKLCFPRFRLPSSRRLRNRPSSARSVVMLGWAFVFLDGVAAIDNDELAGDIRG
jgi:hypothetical protein